MAANTAQTKRFLGLNNVSDPLRLKFGWLQKADNIDITDTGGIMRRNGFAKALDGTSITGAFSTFDFTRAYIVDAGSLMQVNGDLSTATLKSGLSSASMYWTEVNDQVFFNNGIDSGIIQKDGAVLDWTWTAPDMPSAISTAGRCPGGTYQVACTFTLPDGRETGASDACPVTLPAEGGALQITSIPQVAGYTTNVYIAPADSAVFQYAFSTGRDSASWAGKSNELGADLTTQFLNPLPDGCSYLATWRGRIYAAQYMIETDTSVIWESEPLGFHLFGLNDSFSMVPGEVTMLKAHTDGLLIGTQTRIYAYDGEKLDQLADYGVVPGWGADKDDDGQILFWSKRGLCTALPFSNLVLRQISVRCGLSAGAAIVRFDGAKRYVVALQKGGTPFNQRS